jgi:hypothetical protein
MTKEDLVYYLIIIGFCLFMLNPTNLKHKHIHLTVALLISYLILFPSKHMKLRRYIYDLRGILLIYLILDFEVDPLVSLFIFILFLMIVYQIQYSNVTYENFTSMNTEVKKELEPMDNYKYDNKLYVQDSEYKQDNKEDECNGRKFITDEQLDKISNNKNKDISSNGIKTYENGYSAQGTSFILGYNHESYGDLTK